MGDTSQAGGGPGGAEAPVERPVREEAEMAAYKTLWELLALQPEVRWNGGSGALGGVEAMSINGRLMRHPALVYGGVPLGPDLNTVALPNLDDAGILAGFPLYEDVVMNGAEGVRASSSLCGERPKESVLSLSKGDFGSRLGAFNYKECGESWRFRLNLAGASYGGAASYDAYRRDGGSVALEHDLGPGLSAGLQVSKFKSKVIRYTGGKTKTRLGAVGLSAAKAGRQEAAWRARAYYTGNEYSYIDVGPQSEDDIHDFGCAVDFWPGGTDGGQRVSLGLRKESLDRSVRPFDVSEELQQYGTPDQGAQRSLDAAGAYEISLQRGGSRYTGLARVDRKKLFGWSPTFAAGFRRGLGSWGNAAVMGRMASFEPDFFEIYAPRDETSRPSWYMAGDLDSEREWGVSGTLGMTGGRWTASVAGFAALRRHVLAPPPEWLGLGGDGTPALTTPVEDAGNGSASGVSASVEWAGGPGFALGGAYSAQRSRVEGAPAPFQPSHKVQIWVRGERVYFDGDMKVGVVLRGVLYSSQTTYIEADLPSYGTGDALGYLSISDVVFFYQIKNLETRPRPSAVLDLQSGSYLLQPGPEIRFGLVWYLPG
jgi:hypothetical protein